MIINTRFNNVSISNDTKVYLNRRLKSIEKFQNELSDSAISVEIGRTTRHHKKGDVYRAELHLVSGGGNYYSEYEGPDLLQCIDSAKDTLVEKIKSSKTKKETLYKRGKQKIKQLLRRE